MHASQNSEALEAVDQWSQIPITLMEEQDPDPHLSERLDQGQDPDWSEKLDQDPAP